jgi:hypothetical protein
MNSLLKNKKHNLRIWIYKTHLTMLTKDNKYGYKTYVLWSFMVMHYEGIYMLKNFKHAWKEALVIIKWLFHNKSQELKHIAQTHTPCTMDIHMTHMFKLK